MLKILFADEPTGALNSNSSTVVLDVFSKLHREGQSIIMVTHDKKTALTPKTIPQGSPLPCGITYILTVKHPGRF